MEYQNLLRSGKVLGFKVFVFQFMLFEKNAGGLGKLPSILKPK
jgi:hypothetical protein